MSTIVIKIGGGKGIDPTALAPEIAELARDGNRVVVVHGGSHETDQLSRQLGHPPRTLRSPSGHTSRRTDRRTLELFAMAYCGKVNKALVEQLRTHGNDAVGLSGLDAGIWIGKRKHAIRAIDDDGRTIIVRDDLSGRVERVDAIFINTLLDAGRTPVLTPPAATHDGTAINVDADRAAAATAAALHADELLLLSNVPGLLRDPEDPASRINTIDPGDFNTANATARGRMKNKVLAAREAIDAAVNTVVIAAAHGDSPIAAARSGAGTRFSAGTPA